MIHPTISHAAYKTMPSDFIVTEVLPFADNGELSGSGEHLWLFIEKIGMNTTHLAKLLAMWAKIPARDVGYSGLKDRHAVTYQWFSLRLPKGIAGVADLSDDSQIAASLTDFLAKKLSDGEMVKLIQSSLHHKKLSRGTHKLNHFQIILRDISNDGGTIDKSAVDTQLAGMAKTGIPNFFGSQRFGRDAGNVEKAVSYLSALAENPSHRHRDRDFHGLMISVARSAIFNEILAQRLADGTWCSGIDGDVFNLNGTGSLFTEAVDDTIMARLAAGDIHPTGVLYGSDDKLSATGAAVVIEQAVLTDAKFSALVQGLDATCVKAGRRAFRLLIDDLAWQWQDDKTLSLAFHLPTGAYATCVLGMLVANLHEARGI